MCVIVDAEERETVFSPQRLIDSLATHTLLNTTQASLVVKDIMDNMPPRMTHEELDKLVGNRLANSLDCDLQDAAGQYEYEMLRRTLPSIYVEVCRRIRGNMVTVNGNRNVPAPRLSKKFMAFVEEHAEALQSLLDAFLEREDKPIHSSFAMATYRRTYLLKVGNTAATERTAELPEHMYLREAIQVTRYDMALIPETFEFLALKLYTHASPCMFNAGAPVPQLASCFLLETGDSIESIFSTVKKCATISKTGGGIGLNVQPIRSIGSTIKSGGESNGVCPMLKCFEATTSYVSQGNKRRGSCAICVESWNKQIFDICELRLNTGGEANRCRDLFTSIMLNDLFMERVRENGRWVLFCVTDTPDLQNLYGEAFTRRYCEYESEMERYNGKSVRAMSVWKAIIKSLQATGTPYLFSKSNVNKSQHTGLFGPQSTVRTSNLCAEIMQYTSPDHTAVCNLATVNLVKFVRCLNGNPEKAFFDWDLFRRVVRIMTRNVDHTLDDSYYPTECTRSMNLSCRPLGMGIQGLANMFIALGYTFNSEEAYRIDRQIAEVMYYEFLSESCRLAEEKGAYPLFQNSPAARGILQFDMYNMTQKVYEHPHSLVGRHGWLALKERISIHGLRNSLGIAHPPTASTASVTGSVECFEPVYKKVQARKVSSGVVLQLFRPLFDKLKRYGRWNEDVKQLLIKDWGSLDRIPLPAKDKELFVEALDMSMRKYLDHAILRAPFMDQSCSLNHFYNNPTLTKLGNAIMYAFKNKLKTLIYYCRRRPKKETHQFAAISDSLADQIADRLARHFGDGELVEGSEHTPYEPMLKEEILILEAKEEGEKPKGSGEEEASGSGNLQFDFTLPEEEECVMCGS